MTEIDQMKQKNDRMFVLVCLNFTMLFVLFVGLGYVTWQSATLVADLQDKLSQAEQAVAGLQDRIRQVNMDEAMEKVMDSATKQVNESIKSTIQRSGFSARLNNLSANIQDTRDKLERTSEVIQQINTQLKNLDSGQMAQLVSYNMLKGLGDGFNRAAESRKPASTVERAAEPVEAGAD